MPPPEPKSNRWATRARPHTCGLRAARACLPRGLPPDTPTNSTSGAGAARRMHLQATTHADALQRVGAQLA
eukprot:2019155-Alexandrium_andersonii.AAC.1